MSIAIFKPFALAAKEGERVWEKLVQKVVEKDEVDAHVADGWHTDAATALEAANAAEVEKENAALQAQIDTAKATLAKRGKKADAGNVQSAATDSSLPPIGSQTASESPESATPPAEPSA